jgi:phosphoglycolate phosphatase
LSGQETRLLAVDLDGTLVDSAPDIAHCLGTALEAIGFAPPGEARTRVWIAHDCSRHGEAAFASEARQRAALAAFLGCYRDNLFVRSRLYPGVPETLEALRARGVQLCCITNKRHAFSEELLTRAGIRGHFALVLGGDSLAEKKPSPLQLKVAAETLGTAPSAATLVGDSHQDLRAARAAGYGFVLAAYGYGKIDETELGASPRIRSFVELPAALGLGR